LDIELSPEDVEEEEDAVEPKQRTGEKKKREEDPSEEDSDEEYDVKPQKKKSKSKSKKKGKGKAKGKVKEVKAPKKKVLLAKAATWDDIPDWGDRTDSPFLTLPEDVLDLCFNADRDLNVRYFLRGQGSRRADSVASRLDISGGSQPILPRQAR
jgi:hypothetical protein